MENQQVENVKIERLCIGTFQAKEFIDALERLCQAFCSVQDAENGDGYTFKFDVEG